MSNAQVRGQAEERTARVWQPADYSVAGQVGQAFELSAWMEVKSATFEVPTFEKPQPEEELDLQPSAPEAEPEPVEPMAAELPVEPAVHPESQLQAQRQIAFEEGRQQGLREAAEEMQAQNQAWRDQAGLRLESLERGLRELIEAPDQLHEPLKRLALHVAEQLVIGELSIAPQAIERLVRRCVEELDVQKGAPVRVEVHPDDLGPLQDLLKAVSSEGHESAAGKAAPWILQANASVLPGSVRASANDAMVFDLVEHRLEALAGQLLRLPAVARQQSAFKPERLAARKAEVSQVLDAQPRMAEPARGGRFAPVIEASASAIEESSDQKDGQGETPSGRDPEEPQS